MYVQTIIESATQICKAGFKVFPCQYKGKTPISSSYFGFTNGCRSATNDAAQIAAFAEWYAKPFNLALHCEGVLVVDADVKYGGDHTLAKLVAVYGKLPPTPKALTGGSGNHYLFTKPTTHEILNWTNRETGIDTRTDGGYIIVPPSVHDSGKSYEWIVGLDTSPAACPTWMLDWLVAKNAPDKKAVETKDAATDLTAFVFTGPEDDLVLHPGADKSKGEKQHPTLWRLVGKHLARGDHLNTIKHLAIEWGRRCEPPLSEKDVLRHFEGLAHKQERKGGTINFQETPVPTAESEGFNEDDDDQELVLSDEAYYGVLGEFVRTVEPHTEADPAAILVSSLIAAGNAIGNGPYFVADGDRHHTNLFGVCVGESGNARKGVSLKRSLAILDDEYRNKNIVHGLSSGEGLIHAVRDEVTKLDPDSGLYQTIDEGVADKRLLVTETEFAQCLKNIRREGNSLSPILRNAFDSLALSSLTKQCQRATGAHVSIIAHITAKELQKTLSETEAINGFANRFLWLMTRRSKYLPDGGEQVDLEPFRERVRLAVAAAQTVGEMRRSEEAKALWHDLYISNLNPDHPILSRAAAITLRLSMIYALLDNSAIIETSHLRAAYAIWRYAERSVMEVFGAGENDAFEEKVYAAILEHPGIGRKALYDKFNRNVKMTRIADALLRLQAKGKAYPETDDETGGRPAERWHPTPIRPNAETLKAPDPIPASPALGRNDVPASPTPSPVPFDVAAFGRKPLPKPGRIISQPSEKWVAEYNAAQARRIEGLKEIENDKIDPDVFMALLQAMPHQ